MPIVSQPHPTHRACSWCATEFAVVRRPGRPRLYCNHACRQRAYEHRHGFEHERTVRPLPAQARGETWTGTGYERSLSGLVGGRQQSARPANVGAPGGPSTRNAVRPARPAARRPTLQRPASRGVQDVRLAWPTSNPLRFGIAPSNELARLRAMLDEMKERRIDPADALRWIDLNDPLAA